MVFGNPQRCFIKIVWAAENTQGRIELRPIDAPSYKVYHMFTINGKIIPQECNVNIHQHTKQLIPNILKKNLPYISGYKNISKELL